MSTDATTTRPNVRPDDLSPEGTYRLLRVVASAITLGYESNKHHHDLQHARVVEAQTHMDAAITTLTTYIRGLENVADDELRAALKAAGRGGLVPDDRMTHDSAAAVKNQRSEYTDSEDRAK